MIPLIKKLKKRTHRNTAMAQDLMVIEIYNNFPDTVIHGGTAIWRCYSSNRFSEDIDILLPKKYKNEKFLNNFLASVKKKGFNVIKFKKTGSSLFGKFSFSGSIVSIEAIFINKKNFLTKEFELVEGNFITVYTLTVEDLIEEKVEAYLKRRKVRDLYDIYYLLKFADRDKIKKILKKFNYNKPLDEKELKVLIYIGSVPKVEDMMEEIKKWAK